MLERKKSLSPVKSVEPCVGILRLGAGPLGILAMDSKAEVCVSLTGQTSSNDNDDCILSNASDKWSNAEISAMLEISIQYTLTHTL